MNEDTVDADVSQGQEWWDSGLQCFTAGNTAVETVRDLWKDPKGDLGLLAAIIGALYADTYWAATRMDANKLASDLHAVTLVNPDLCLTAASKAFSGWSGLFLRANMNDDGRVPKRGHVTASPDVAYSGSVKLTPQQLIERWGKTDWPSLGLQNYAYGRAQSLRIQVPITKPSLSMFSIKAALNPPPTSWTRLYTWEGARRESPMVDIHGMSTIAPTFRCANEPAFRFNPPGSGAYSLIAVAGTEFFENSPLQSISNWDSQEWRRNNGAAGWRGVTVSASGKEVLEFYNQDDTPELFVFEAHCRNLASGSEVGMTSDAVALASAARITAWYQVVTAEVEVPANHEGELAVRFPVLPPKGSVDVQLYWVLAPGHRHYPQALGLLADDSTDAARDAVRIPMGNYTFVGSLA